MSLEQREIIIEADYRLADTERECGNCGFFVDGEVCALFFSQVKPNAVCDSHKWLDELIMLLL